MNTHDGESSGGMSVNTLTCRDCGEEFVYTIYPKADEDEAEIWLKVQTGMVTFFGMPGTKQEDMPTVYDGPVSAFNPEKESVEA